MPDSRRLNLVLAGIGLVLVGLLAGILLMLVVDDGEPAASVTRVVDRVELGSSDPPLRTAEADSGLSTQAPDPTALNRLFRKVAGRVTSAVVFIQVRTKAPRGASSEGYREFEGDMRDYFFRNPVPRQSVGSGVIISPKGYVVTNHHVVDRAEEIQVTLADKRQFTANVVGVDPSTDLAVLKLDAREDVPSMPLGNSDRVEVGDWVVAVGNPFRLTSTVTAGIVSALGRQVNIIEDSFRIEDFIQTDAAINPGNSGGALVNLQGELVGINTAIATESGSYEGYGFAVPVNLMERVARDLIAYGEVRRGYLGISIQEVDATMARDIGLQSIRGVYVGSVRDGGAADRAGLRDGDVVLTIETQRVDAPNELQSVVARFRPGDDLRVTVWRDGTEQAFDVQLMGRNAPAYQDWMSDAQPSDDPSTPRDDPGLDERPTPSGEEITELGAWGMGLRPMATREQRAFDVEAGVYVAYVESEGRAADAGVPRDVVITRVGDAAVDTPDAVKRALDAAAASVLVQVARRDGTRAFYEIQ